MGSEFDGGPADGQNLTKPYLTEGPSRAQNLTYYPPLRSCIQFVQTERIHRPKYLSLGFQGTSSSTLHRARFTRGRAAAWASH